MAKKPKTVELPKTSKSPANHEKPESHTKDAPVWSLCRFDRESRWGESAFEGVDAWKHLFEKLKSYERMTWGQINSNQRRDHSVPTGNLIKEARERLQQLKLDDVDELFRFRFEGKHRLWGIVIGNVFQILWWDKNHEICPSTLKNT
ncbi:hypothetical protein SH668x_001269 [Planctomicrobium sp. SH668]|uniref:hypothetical protein n=1 Tax=Planctomicrobium sp. SH668 TaxID=3448126 RepID=UPI003F5CB9BB